MEMFLWVGLRAEDRCAQRFLWEEREGETIVYQMNVLPFGTTCSPSLAQYVRNENATRFQEQYPEAAEAIVELTYVDDYLHSFNSNEEAIEMVLTVQAIHRSGGFDMHKWISNSPEVLRALGCLPSTGEKEVSQNSFVLGMQWTSSDDLFSFRARGEGLKYLLELERPTKKQPLAMSLYDPLGLASFITKLARIMMRDMWRTPLKWDDPLSSDLIQTWRQTVAAVGQLEQIAVPRWPP